MIQIINSEQFDIVEFPFNIVENEYTRKVIPLAKEHDIGTVVMKPLGGGQLASVADYSLRWILGHEITCVIPGMRSEEEVRKNAALGTALTPLDTKEYEELEKGR